jgi:hypothetical protein
LHFWFEHFIYNYPCLESGPKGFYAQFPKGPMQKVSNTTSCEPSLKIKFNCNLKANWFVPIGDVTASAPEPTDIDIDPNDPCLVIRFELQISYEIF